jgi:NAD(P)-dependent dehydrogenase (short-subunit alcohol dehydrogenase family)
MWRRPSVAALAPQLLVGKAMAITGGVTGIGRAIAIGYLTHGANVAVNHFGDPKSSEQFQTLLDEASQSLGGKEEAQKRLIEVPGDVGDPETGKKLVAAVIAEWGRLDVFISNAGICEFREFLEYVPLHSAHYVFDTNANDLPELHQISGTKPSPPTSRAHTIPFTPPQLNSPSNLLPEAPLSASPPYPP